MSDQLQMTDGMHIIVEALKQNNIDTIYGVVGIPVTDMARHAQAEGIRYIGFRHEQSAGYAAAASGFLTQKPGICLTVSAPGFLNGLTALANATVNGFPMIMISGSSDRAIVDLQPKQHFALISRRILALHWHALSGSLYRVALAEFILICQQMSWPRRWKKTKR